MTNNTGANHQLLAPRFPLPHKNWEIDYPAYTEWNLSVMTHLELMAQVSLITTFCHGFIMNSGMLTPYIGKVWTPIYSTENKRRLMDVSREVRWFQRYRSFSLQAAEIGLVLGSVTWADQRSILDDKGTRGSEVGIGLTGGLIAGAGMTVLLTPQQHWESIWEATPETSTTKAVSTFLRTFRPAPKLIFFGALSHTLHYGTLLSLYRTTKHDLYPFATGYTFAAVWLFSWMGCLLQYATMQLYHQTLLINTNLSRLKLPLVNEWVIFTEKYCNKGKMTQLASGVIATRPGLRSLALTIAVVAYDRLCCMRSQEKLDPTKQLASLDRSKTWMLRSEKSLQYSLGWFTNRR